MADARKDKRTLLSLKIRYKSASLEEFIERYSSDISGGGVFIKAKKPLPVGTLLKFEFILQDESTLIHGVGRVVWRREAADASPHDPAGMGIKFIKMDPDSRSVVQRISQGRAFPGVFEQGKEGDRAPQPILSDLDDEEEDQTKVRHVSEFLASALEEGGAGEVAQREAQAGAQRARKDLDGRRAVAAHGAFAGTPDAPAGHKASVAGAQARGAMSAFGGASVAGSTGSSGLTTATRMSSASAPALDGIDPEDDFLEDETTKIHDYPSESYPPDAAPTRVAAASDLPHDVQRYATPVVPVDDTGGNPLEADVPDLFGSDLADSLGPNPGEMIDARLLDADDSRPAAAVPEAPGIPREAFKVPQSAEPVWTTRPTPPKKARPVILFVLFAALVVAGVAVAAWQFGLVDQVIASLVPDEAPAAQSPLKAEAVAAAPLVPKDEAAEVPEAREGAEANAANGTEEADVAEEMEPEVAAAAVAPEPVEAADSGKIKFQVVTEPAGAFVSVNGKRAGRTPLDVEYDVGTKLSIYSKVRGYLGQRQQVVVAAGQEAVSFALVPLPYVVEVVTSPAGATASSIGGGVTDTPGELRFKTMPRSRKIVISMDGYEKATTFVKRVSFTEETRRMFATVNVSMKKAGAAPVTDESAPTPSEPTPEAKAEVPAAPAEVKAEPEPPAAPEAAEEAPAPSETAPADAP
ncbi:MAG: TIGR02266 family protein [Polyangiales bacterium]